MAKKKYNPKTFPKRAEKYARDGLIDIQIAAKLGINVATYYRYQNEHSEFCDAIKRGKSVIDQEVENALLKRAMGFEYDEIRTEVFEDQNQAKTGDKKIDKAGTKKHVTKVTKKVLSDTTAAIFWLKNRRPDLWRDKVIQEQHVIDETQQATIDKLFDSMTYEEKLKYLEEQERKNAK